MRQDVQHCTQYTRYFKRHQDEVAQINMLQNLRQEKFTLECESIGGTRDKRETGGTNSTELASRLLREQG